ncbi:MAG: hypothetical protein NTX76_03580 [Alphaproteobacteria bacterium]|nr:hypothetical protein [Alphaproteobacteria bacterium]
MKIFSQLLVLIMGWGTLATAASSDGLQAQDDLKLLIPVQYKPCIEMLYKIGDFENKLTLRESVELIREQTNLIGQFNQDNQSPFYEYIEQQQPILLTEINRLEELFQEKRKEFNLKKRDDLRFKDPCFLQVYQCLYSRALDFNDPRKRIPNERHLREGWGQYWDIGGCYELLPYSQPFHLPEMISLNTHKILHMYFIGHFLDRLWQDAFGESRRRLPDVDLYGDEPFVDVFDKTHRKAKYLLRCGKKVFDYVRAMKPYIDYATDDEIREHLTDYQGQSHGKLPEWAW